MAPNTKILLWLGALLTGGLTLGVSLTLDAETFLGQTLIPSRILLIILGAALCAVLFLSYLTLRSRRLEMNLTSMMSTINEELVTTVETLRETQEKLKAQATFASQNPYPVLRLSAEGRILFANAGAEPVLTEWDRAVGREAPPKWAELAQRALAEERPQQSEVSCDGRHFFLALVPAETYVNLYGADITDRLAAEDELRLGARVLETTHEGIMITNPAGIVEKVNPAFTTITGFRPHEVMGRLAHLFDPGLRQKEFVAELGQALEVDGQWQGELWNRRKSGEAYPEWATVSAIRDSSGVTVNLVVVFSDITEIKRSVEEITHQAYHDALTGLPNRLLFNDRLEVALSQARRSSGKLAIIFLDLDRFKEVNDTLGHDVGDLLLKAVSERLKDSLREEDTVARLGGDEFIILLHALDRKPGAEEVARKLVATLAEPVELGEHRVKVTTSLGVAVYPDHGEDAESLIKNADLAMYQAKHRGRDNYQCFSPELSREDGRKVILETDLRRAMAQGEIEVYYQPLLHLAENRVVGLEALIRWPMGAGRRFSPKEFIRTAEETGLIIDLGQWALRRSIRLMKGFKARSPEPLTLTINLSPGQLAVEKMAASLEALLKETGFDPARLNIEVMAEDLLREPETLRPVLEELNRLGTTLTLDHFSLESSPLHELSRIRLSRIKLDKEVISGIGREGRSREVLRAVVALAHSLGLEVIGPGVVRTTQRRALAEIGVDLIQGPLLSRALPPEEIDHFLRR